MMSFDTLFADPRGRTSRGQFIGGLIVLLAVTAFYFLLVKGRSGQWTLLTLLFPAVVLHARRFHDMGLSAWVLLGPVVLVIASAWLSLGKLYPEFQMPLSSATIAICVAFIGWALFGKAQAGANRYGEPVAG